MLLGGLFGGLAQGAQAGIGQQQLQQQIGLQAQAQDRLQQIAERQAALQFHQLFVNTLQLDPNERGPALDKLAETAQNMRIPVDPTIFAHAKKLNDEQSAAMVQLLQQVLPGMPTDQLQNLPKNYFQLLPLLIQARHMQDYQKGQQDLETPTPTAPATSPTAPPPVSGQVGQPQDEMSQLKALAVQTEAQLRHAAQFSGLVPQAKEEATLLNARLGRIQQRIQHLEGGQQVIVQTPQGPMHIQVPPGGGTPRILGPAVTATNPNQLLTRPDIEAAISEAAQGQRGPASTYLDVAKTIPIQAGGAVLGGTSLLPGSQVGGGNQEIVKQPGMVSRTAKPEAAEVDKISKFDNAIQSFKELAKTAESVVPSDTLGRSKLALRAQAENVTRGVVSGLSKEERDYQTKFLGARTSMEAALAGLAGFRSPAMMNILNQIIGPPFGVGASHRLQAAAKWIESQREDLIQNLKTTGRGIPTPRTLGQKTPQQEAEEFLRGR